MFIKKLNEPGSLLKPPLTQKLKSGLVVLHPGEDVGEHVTEKREEIIVILEGEATVFIEGNKENTVLPDHMVFIPEGKTHNITNRGKQVLRYIYIVTLF